MFADMIISAANNLSNNKQQIDALNVFPVPDGDTGTNMSLTALATVDEVKKYISSSVSDVAQAFSMASLRGARGNSGVILSQFYRGIAKSLKGLKTCTPRQFAAALDEGAQTAYKAVMKPTEGTILTVAREAAHAAVSISDDDIDFLAMFEHILKEGNISLENTPNLLPALKQANVVDAGGKGWMTILEGMYFALKGEVIVADDKITENEVDVAQTHIGNENILFPYCTEFIIEKNDLNSDILNFKNLIKNKGDSMLVIDDEDIVKVHIHTSNPGFIIEQAIKIGSLFNIKIDNMKLQNQRIVQSKQGGVSLQKEKNAIIAIGVGDGISQILSDLGVGKIIEGGQTMNPSTQDVLDAINDVNADNVYILPNNKNIILAATQAKELSDKNVIVIPTKTIPQGISAILSFSKEAEANENESAMNEAISNVKSASVTFAVRDTEIDEKKIKSGDILGINENVIDIIGKDADEVCLLLIATMIDKSSSIITVLYGKDIPEEVANNLSQRLEDIYSDFDIIVKSGGQPLYYYIISVE